MIYIDDNSNLNLSKLHPNQKEFVKSTTLNTGIVGGYQSGKSQAAVTKCLTKLLQNPGVPIAYYLPNYRLIGDMLVPKFTNMFENIGINITHHVKDSKIITPYGEIWMRSMEKPDSIVSYSVWYSLVDEVDLVHPNKRKDVMGRITSRNSYKTKYKNCMDFVSTPEGFAYMYQHFVKNDNKNKQLLRLSTLDNEDNLGDGYIDGLRELYTEQQLKAYLNGEFVNLTSGSVYHTYDRDFHESYRTVNDYDALHIGIDFNVTNMHAVVCVVDGREATAVDEFVNIYDTRALGEAIRRKYPKHRIVAYPDASGSKRTSNSNETDHQILKEHRMKINAPSKNPGVSNRVNMVNAGFLNSKGETRLYVNTNACPVLTEALEKQAYKKGVPDKDSGFDHINEAFGYFSYRFLSKKSMYASAG